jgi:hypothetical protein
LVDHNPISSGKRVRKRTTLSFGFGDGDLEGPALPADLVVAPGEPGLAAALLEELDGELAPAAAARAHAGRGSLGVELALQGGGALVDHGLELVVVDVGEGEVEDLAGLRGDGGEEAVEEDGVEDTWAEYFE